MIEGADADADDLLLLWSRVRSIDVEAWGLYFAQEMRLPNLLELGLNQSLIRKHDHLSHFLCAYSQR